MLSSLHPNSFDMLSFIATTMLDEIADLLKSLPKGLIPKLADFEKWGKEFAGAWVSAL